MNAVIPLTLACIAMLASNANAQGFGLPMGAELQQQNPQLTEEQTKCFQSFIDNNMGTCLQDLANSYQTQKISIPPQCCSYVTSMHSACASAVHFQNPLFQTFVQQHCSGSTSGSSPVGRKSMPAASGSATGSGLGGSEATGSGARR